MTTSLAKPMNQLPENLRRFLREGRQLSYEVERSSIGRITLKSDSELMRSIIRIGACEAAELDDPYRDLSGDYPVEVISLVKSSEDYSPEGLLCWIISLQRFGCVDVEHGTVLAFPSADWLDIVERPADYLDSQWGVPPAGGNVISQIILPWLHFDFKLSDSPIVLSPYPLECRIHNRPVAPQMTKKPQLFDVIRRRLLGDWLSHYLSDFPHSGVPLNGIELLYCEECRSAEDRWFNGVFDAIETREAKAYADRWVQCPGCGIRFSTKNEHSFQRGVHLSCGQKIRVVD